MGILDKLGSLFSRSPKKRPAKKPARAAVGKCPDGELSVDMQCKPKGRKKAGRFTSAPVDESALGFSISIKTDGASKRNAIRVQVDNLTVFIPRLNKTLEAADISATGLGFRFLKPRVKGGAKIQMDILLDGNREVEGVTCKVMRHEQGVVGCAFIDLDRAQEDAISRIVLLGQKQQAERKTARKDQDFKLPD
ncbi:MAG: PilZ domain-containing protein [Pseudodesulfovibrio sp.]|jgi:hypothetical protein|uniref:PilZ domain-containing protein n=1 Tax=Pseudodesulfovibrio indicus TaxID=1716143 RepID=A0A126QNJ3_9BACT|nr:PilZ domain-containing protein [Pseudodesulfovibrio indicus]AMK11542.1 hypothetical protein AWY79_10645 [Pseudodesulfovibrio indicus]TDT89945.1 PilZ domain-containing protein [Pseudodesulfovibrio indicus]